jgi:fluoride ion exporter CrcB/FEX
MTNAGLSMSELLLVGLGGAIGAGIRVWLRSVAVHHLHGTWRVTLGVNLVGSIVIGLIAAPLIDRPMVRLLMVPGGCALDAVIAVDERRWWRAATILLGTLVGCPLACLAVLRGVAT